MSRSSQQAVDAGSTRRRILLAFNNFYLRRGYLTVWPAPLIPRDDPSLLFTNASIVGFKPYVMTPQSIPESGFCVVQPCIRVHNLKSLDDPGFRPNYVCLFDMLGTLARISRFDQVNVEFLELFERGLGVPRARIFVETRSEDADFADIWDSLVGPANVSRNTLPAEHYRWQFGVLGLTGRGITVSIRPPNPSVAPVAVGNVIVLRKGPHEVAVETALGVETTLCALTGAESCLSVSVMASLMDTSFPAAARLADLLAPALALYRAGLRPGNRKEAHVLKRMVKGIVLCLEEEPSLRDELVRAAPEFERQALSGQGGATADLLTDLDRYQSLGEANIRRFRQSVQGAEAPTTEALETLARATFGLSAGQIRRVLSEEAVDREPLSGVSMVR